VKRCVRQHRGSRRQLGNATGASYRIERQQIDRNTIGEIIDLQAGTTSYFRVYLSTGDRWLVPRPDGELVAACKIPDALSDIARRSGLCNVPVSEERSSSASTRWRSTTA
jgi:hypothetical protein